MLTRRGAIGAGCRRLPLRRLPVAWAHAHRPRIGDHGAAKWIDWTAVPAARGRPLCRTRCRWKPGSSRSGTGHSTAWRRCRRASGRDGGAGRGRSNAQHGALHGRATRTGLRCRWGRARHAGGGCARRRSGAGLIRRRSARRTRPAGRRIHHEHRALELGCGGSLQVEPAFGASRGRIGILRPTVRAKHSSPPVPKAHVPSGISAYTG